MILPVFITVISDHDKPQPPGCLLENFKKRLKALEEKVARDGIELTDSQIAALERKA